MATIDPEKLTAWYDFQAPFYSLWRNTSEHPTFETVLAALGNESAQHVLDAGCGSGLFSLAIASRRPAWTVYGVDASRGMVEVAQRQAQRQGLTNLQVEVGDLRRLGWEPEKFDSIVLSGVFPNLSEPLQTAQEMHRLLKVGGRLVVVEFDRQRMSTLTRLFFRLMIWGYRTVSAIFRRFRFAEGWSLEATTIPSEDLVKLLGRAGFVSRPVAHVSSYYILTLVKEPPHEPNH